MITNNNYPEYRLSNTPLYQISLAVDEPLEIKVRVEARKKSRLPPHFGRKYRNYPLGKLRLFSADGQLSETVLLQGSLKPVQFLFIIQIGCYLIIPKYYDIIGSHILAVCSQASFLCQP